MITLHSVAGGLQRLVSLPFVHSTPNRTGNSYAVTVVTPIRSDEMRALRQVLRGFRPGSHSPLARITYVQFARWVIIDQLRTRWPGAPERPSTLNTPYLLFSADLTAPAGIRARLPQTFFRDLAIYMRAECDAVWGKCLGFPGARDVDSFVDYLTRSQVDIGLYYAAFPNTTPHQIRAAVDVRKRFARFVSTHESAIFLPPAAAGAEFAYDQLKTAYLREFAP